MNTLKLLQAAKFASEKHKMQKRKGEDAAPYINHPIEVAALIADVGKIDDTDVLTAALLHDTIEDTETTPEEIERIFGTRVKEIVLEVTDDKTLPKQERKRLQIVHGPGLTPEAALIKIADKISNVSDITYSPPKKWNIERRKEYLDWAEKVVNSISTDNRLLIEKFKAILLEGRAALGNGHELHIENH